ncbi:protein kinase [Streptosporangium sp. NPDC049046]|uniref:protein kinase domain-containing protein n=1 Tax=Streptosporangium sp. NPDC049046 TaxID=3155031 RepID=UPI0034278B86
MPNSKEIKDSYRLLIAERRYRNEVKQMVALSGEAGVIPVIDYDRSDDPSWFVMPEAEMLAKHLESKPDFYSAVSAVHQVAETLARLAKQKIAHRDIKPDNLFWYEHSAVVGDFGIAAWPGREPLTSTGEKVGAVSFLAPEMLKRPKDVSDNLADVWSLAKTMFVLALPGRGLHPPGGTHVATAREFSLWSAGGKAAESIGHLLEAATRFRPHDRPSMQEFANELGYWLETHASDTQKEPPRSSAVTSGWRPLIPIIEHLRSSKRTIHEHMQPAISNLSMEVTGNPHSWITEDGTNGFTIVPIGDHDFEPNSEDGFEPEADIVYSITTPDKKLHIVFNAILEQDSVYLIAEIQRVAESGILLEKQWRKDASVKRPSMHAHLNEIFDEVAKWIRENL